MAFSNGSLVVLTTNLWTDAKLVNGSKGIMQKIVFQDKESPAEGHIPAFMLVELKDYIGPMFLPNHPTWVPIKAITKSIMPMIAMVVTITALILIMIHITTLSVMRNMTINNICIYNVP